MLLEAAVEQVDLGGERVLGRVAVEVGQVLVVADRLPPRRQDLDVYAIRRFAGIAEARDLAAEKSETATGLTRQFDAWLAENKDRIPLE